MTTNLSAATLKQWLHDGREIAVFDVREHGQYGEGHLFYGIPLPFSVLEQEVTRLAPRRSVRMVVYDDGTTDPLGGVAVRAARQLVALGYTAVHTLEGGVRAWEDAGYVLFKGVNLPSKAFGELIEAIDHTPRIAARELAARLAGDTPPVVLDGRPFSEFQKMSIPHAVCCPNGELAYRLRALVPDATRTIVINCAGRTRSIIGAQTLINLGIGNPVFALENGTQGWYLEDLVLDHGRTARYQSDARGGRHESDALMRERAEALARRAGVEWIGAEAVRAWTERAADTVYLCDVRTEEEFATATLTGAQHTPGGQLQQATDHYVGVRHARLVLFDDDGIRAPVVASWLRQLGHRAYVLQSGLNSGLAWCASVPDVLPAPPLLRPIAVRELAALIAEPRRGDDVTPDDVTPDDATSNGAASNGVPVHVIDLRSSEAYRGGHIPGARWSIRPALPRLLDGLTGTIVLVSDTPATAQWAAAEFSAELRGRVRLLAGGWTAWKAAGQPVSISPEEPSDAERIDFLFFTHDRHHGNKAAARAYLAWEMGLLAQLDASERADFRPLRSAPQRERRD